MITQLILRKLQHSIYNNCPGMILDHDVLLSNLHHHEHEFEK